MLVDVAIISVVIVVDAGTVVVGVEIIVVLSTRVLFSIRVPMGVDRVTVVVSLVCNVTEHTTAVGYRLFVESTSRSRFMPRAANAWS